MRAGQRARSHTLVGWPARAWQTRRVKLRAGPRAVMPAPVTCPTRVGRAGRVVRVVRVRLGKAGKAGWAGLAG